MDFQIVDTYSGGDLVFENDDIQLISEVYNQPYLSHFGGNKEAVTEEYIEGLPRQDYWANTLLLPEKERLNSYFERALNEYPISSSGRIKIEQAAKDDLAFLDGFANTTSEVTIPSVDKVSLKETISDTQSGNFTYIWTEAKEEILQ